MFNFNAVFQRKPKTPDMTPEELESIDVMADYDFSNQQIIDSLKKGEDLGFILVRQNLYLTKLPAERLLRKLHIKREDCLIPEGIFALDNGSTVSFRYDNKDITKDEVRQAAESKIAKFLKSKGIEVRHISHFI